MKKSDKPHIDDFPIICTYCKIMLNGPEAETYGEEACSSPCISHGICPGCLLENFPQEYLSIQKEKRLRIKNIYKSGYPTLNGKLKE